MRSKVILFISLSLVLVVLVVLTLSRNFPLNSGKIGNPTAKEILTGNPDADILKLDGLVYSNASELEWIKDNEYTRGDQIGEIRKQTTNTWWYRNFSASKLQKGTKIYTSNDKEYKSGDAPVIVLVEGNNELLVYHSLREG
ncbi:hypothetical protein [Aquibacillus saliphilus]|uniref:hypothetical protein n=1 Tax=Aquibacillus saliphilus TaxID=1909422 RepID=UPI001CEFC7D9|nr:hypothetical protein [Aquibacillus saliphilus]